MQEKSPRLQAALAFAQQGLPVFPLLPNSKLPLPGSNGFKDATTDPAKLEAYWAEADYNVGFAPSMVGWSVIDLDGEAGQAAWDKLAKEHNVPETFTVSTPRGGRHLYFDGDMPMSQWTPTGTRNLGEHIDTRGTNTKEGDPGAYVLLPPSIMYGKPYVTERNIDLAPAPAFAVAKLAPTHKRVEGVEGNIDLPGSLYRARTLLTDYVERGDIAIEGRGGDSRTYQLACELQNLGVSADQAAALIEEVWNPACIPPWEPDELRVKIDNAYSYAQNGEGAWTAEPLSQSFAAALANLPEEAPAPKKPNRFKMYNYEEQEAVPDPRFVINEIIPERSTVLLLGPSGALKSFVAQDFALGIAMGVETFGSVPERKRVFYAASEGLYEVMKTRKHAWFEARGLKPIDGKNWFMCCDGPLVASPEWQEEWRSLIREELSRCPDKVGLIVIDTTAEAMTGMDGSSDKDAGLFVHFCRQLVREFDCSILAIHHYGKDFAQGSRGSSALPAGFDTRLEVLRKPETLELTLKVLHHKNFAERKEPFYCEAVRVSKSLVINPMSLKEAAAADEAKDALSYESVASALVNLHALGSENAVTSTVLASELTPWGEYRTEEENLDAQKRTARNLEGLGRSRLKGYCQKQGRAYVWFIPSSVSEAVQRAVQTQTGEQTESTPSSPSGDSAAAGDALAASGR